MKNDDKPPAVKSQPVKVQPPKAVDEAAQEQFPAKAGQPEVEIAARSQDIAEPTASRHEKVFVVQANPLAGDYTDPAHEATHVANIDAMRQQAILQGLRPTSDGEFVGAEDHEDGQSVCLRYAVDVVPASIGTPEQQMVRVTVEDQHRLEQQREHGYDSVHKGR